MVKNMPAMQDTWILSLGWEDSLKKGMATHLIFCPGELHEQGSLVGYSPWCHEESDMSERLSVTDQSTNFIFAKTLTNFSLKKSA